MEIDMNITSWSDQDLESLCLPENHKITFDGYEYWWYHKIHGNKWDLHYINGFKDWKKPYSWLQATLYKWSRELTDRKVKSASSYFYQMKQNLERTKEVMSISNNKKLKTKVKIRLIRELMPQETVQYVADVLKISRQAVHRHL
jgi:hypothetical protein|tara:strand:+ start:85 stop:516 length:432 start_codon:yes stop_codon:yes gene_type:complete